MRRALIAAVVTSSVLAARRRRPAAAAAPTAPAPVPAQRGWIIEDDADLSVADQQAQDERILALLDGL